MQTSAFSKVSPKIPWQVQRQIQQAQCGFEEASQRYLAGEPLGYILGQEPFSDFWLETQAGVFLPRLATADWLEQWTQPCWQGQALDLGCGSGSISLYLAKKCQNLTVTAVDSNANALKLTARNAHLHRVADRIRLIKSSWFSSLAGQVFDWILANPPYLDLSCPWVNQSCISFEPHCALYAQQGGWADLSAILVAAPMFSHPLTGLAIEHGADQGYGVMQLMHLLGYTKISRIFDQQGFHRATVSVCPGLC